MTRRVGMNVVVELVERMVKSYDENRTFDVCRDLGILASLAEAHPEILNAIDEETCRSVSEEMLHSLNVFQNIVDDGYKNILNFRRVTKCDN